MTKKEIIEEQNDLLVKYHDIQRQLYKLNLSTRERLFKLEYPKPCDIGDYIEISFKSNPRFFKLKGIVISVSCIIEEDGEDYYDCWKIEVLHNNEIHTYHSTIRDPYKIRKIKRLFRWH